MPLIGHDAVMGAILQQPFIIVNHRIVKAYLLGELEVGIGKLGSGAFFGPIDI